MITDPTMISQITAWTLGFAAGGGCFFAGRWVGRRPNAERERALRQIADDAKEESEARHRSIIHLASMRDAALAELAERTRTIRYLRNQIEEMSDEVRHWNEEVERLGAELTFFKAAKDHAKKLRKDRYARQKGRDRLTAAVVSTATDEHMNGSGAPLEART